MGRPQGTARAKNKNQTKDEIEAQAKELATGASSDDESESQIDEEKNEENEDNSNDDQQIAQTTESKQHKETNTENVENTKNDNDETNNEETKMDLDVNLNKDPPVPEEIKTKSLSSSSGHSEEISAVTLTEDQRRAKRKKRRDQRELRHNKKLKSLKINERRRKVRMQIKTKVYKQLNVNVNPSDEEAEPEDEFLELEVDTELRKLRTEFLERQFTKRANIQLKELIKLNELHQRPISDMKFDGSHTSLNSFWINLKTTAKSRGWMQFAEVLIEREQRNLARICNLLEHPTLMSNTDYKEWMKKNEDLATHFLNDRSNMYTAILNTMTQSVRNRLNATAHDIRDGMELALWVHSTYSMQTEQKENDLLAKITHLSITKSRSMEAFFTYVESLAALDNDLMNRHCKTLLDAVIRELMSLTKNTSFITIIQSLISKHKADKEDLKLNDLLKAARVEYQTSKVGKRWIEHNPPKQAPRVPKDHTDSRAYGSRSHKDAEIVALRAQLAQYQKRPYQTYQKPQRQSKPFESDYGPGKDFTTKDDFFNWKWSKPLNDEPVIKNNKIWYFCNKCNCWTFHPTTKCRHPDGYVRRRPDAPAHNHANVAKINSNPKWEKRTTKSDWSQYKTKPTGWGHKSTKSNSSWGGPPTWKRPPVRDERGDSDPPNKSFGLKDFE